MGTGLRPQRPPVWERHPTVPMSGSQANGPQGPGKTVYGQESRSIVPAGVAQAPIPSEVTASFDEANGGGLINQLVAGRPGMNFRRSAPGDDTNVSGTPGGATGGLPGPNTGGSRAPSSGSASGHVTRGTF